MKYAPHFGLAGQGNGDIDFTGYHALFGTGTVVEHDHRFAALEQVRHAGHRPGQVYGNIPDTPVRPPLILSPGLKRCTTTWRN